MPSPPRTLTTRSLPTSSEKIALVINLVMATSEDGSSSISTRSWPPSLVASLLPDRTNFTNLSEN